DEIDYTTDEMSDDEGDIKDAHIDKSSMRNMKIRTKFMKKKLLEMKSNSDDDDLDKELFEPISEKLPNLRCFSLYCDMITDAYDELIVSLLHRMSNLEKSYATIKQIYI
ncbi:unnamed protein product, partial [Rotaria sp. Silwood1]